ncbi:methyltransferase [Streptomyces sp. NPDC058653]|uniref:methyltransferase n=1 Tax=Streptomyces sp. NPDC058653 TaxID=3346576 RepID=UPI003655B4E3
MSTIHWTEGDRTRRGTPSTIPSSTPSTTPSTVHTAEWHSESGAPAPERVVVADDRMKAGTASRLAREGTALLWRGDFHNARQLLSAMSRRLGPEPVPPGTGPAESFRLHRRARGRRARVLGKLLVTLEDDHSLALRRAPDVRLACGQAYGPPSGVRAVALSELLGVIGARQWRDKGVEVPALGARIHPHYGVFSPVRGEYVDLVARAPLNGSSSARPRTAFDLGTGTGVLAAVLAGRGAGRVVATDIGPRALVCADENVRALGFADTIEVVGPCLYPRGRADLIVCNPPWIPARPNSAIEQAVYDPGGGMLHGFLDGLVEHLEPGGEGWLVLSDLAEHLGLRTRDELLSRIAAAGLRVVDRADTRPRHPRAADTTDPLHTARAAEVTSLWRLRAVDG